MSTDMPERKKTRGAQLLRDRLRRQSGSGEQAGPTGREIPVAPRGEPLPLSFAQRRFHGCNALAQTEGRNCPITGATGTAREV